ncbi:ABC transporter permease [Pseudonocardia nematodicida]|uniref:ABC transporter permease n=1 Tax=Pseudonocardia nematodicida TaxID=1206997 RepID=A0ABV1KHY3_9PSEU
MPVLVFFTRRAVAAVVLLVAITALAFTLVYSSNNNIARNILGELATQEQIDALSAELGLDRPLVVQYLDWLVSAVQGDLGVSFVTGTPVVDSLAIRLPVTLSLVTVSLVVAALIAIVLGIVAAVRRGWVDRGVQIFSVAAESLPNFWVGLALVSTFAIGLAWFPATGYVPIDQSVTGWVSTITLPVIALALSCIASTAQQIRSAVIDVLKKDYVRTLRARGLPEGAILARNVLRNAAPPAVTVVSLQFIGMLSGAVLIERVFALPGLGSLAVNAAIQSDIPVVMGVLVVAAVIVVVVNLAVDLAVTWINPKARIQ